MSRSKKHIMTIKGRKESKWISGLSNLSPRIRELRVLLPVFIIIISLTAACGRASQKENELYVVTSIDEFRQQVASDPAMELVDLERVIDGIMLDIRYATDNNFTGEVIYTMPKAYVRIPVAEALGMVNDSLRAHGMGIIVYDAYRPYSATVRFYEVYPDTEFVADPKFGSKHNRGCAVDVSLFDLTTGEEVLMPTEFDEFSERARHSYTDLPEEAINNRSLLTGVMKHFGFAPYPSEWWHFDYQGWDKYPLMNISFEDLEKSSQEFLK